MTTLWRASSVLLVCVVLNACSAFRPGNDAESQYQRTQLVDPLKLPPGLRRDLTSEETLGIEDSALRSIVHDAQLKRDGDIYWLDLNSRPEVVWGPLLKFLDHYQLSVANADEVSGLIETHWRAVATNKEQKSWWSSVTSKIGGLLPGSESETEKEKFIFRVERHGSSASRIFSSHRRLLERSRGSRKLGISQAGEPQYEAAILHRFLVYLGYDPKASRQMLQQVVSNDAPAQVSEVQDGANGPMLVIGRPISIAWPHVERAAQRLGMEVWGQERAQGRIGVQWQALLPDSLDQSELAQMAPEEVPRKQFILQLAAAGEGEITVLMLGAQAPLSADTQRAFLRQLSQYLP